MTTRAIRRNPPHSGGLDTPDHAAARPASVERHLRPVPAPRVALAGARLAGRGMPTSSDSLLRRLRILPDPQADPLPGGGQKRPRLLGIHDFALRHVYGSTRINERWIASAVPDGPSQGAAPGWLTAGDADIQRPAIVGARGRSGSGPRPGVPLPGGRRAPGASRTVPGPGWRPAQGRSPQARQGPSSGGSPPSSPRGWQGSCSLSCASRRWLGIGDRTKS